MATDFDAARIGVQLDRAEEMDAIETDVAEVLRKLVRGYEAARVRARPRHEAFRRVRNLNRGYDRSLENAHQIAIAIRDRWIQGPPTEDIDR